MILIEYKQGGYVGIDEKGNKRRVFVRVDGVEVVSRDGVRKVPGQRQLHDEYGRDLNYVSKGEYAEVFSGMKIVSDDPNAP